MVLTFLISLLAVRIAPWFDACSMPFLSFSTRLLPQHKQHFTKVTEDFDETLDRHIRSLAAEKELIQVQLAERRATTPGLVRGLMDDLEQRRRAGERVPEEEDGDGESMQVDDKRTFPLLFSDTWQRDILDLETICFC